MVEYRSVWFVHPQGLLVCSGALPWEEGVGEPGHPDLIHLWLCHSFPQWPLQAFSFPSHVEVTDFIRPRTRDKGECGGRLGLEGSRRPIRWDSPSYTRGGLVIGGSQISVLVSRGPDSWEAQVTPTYCGPNAHKQGTEGTRGRGKGLLL